KSPARAGLFTVSRCSRSAADKAELLLEPAHATATVDELLAAAGPGRMRRRVDVEDERVAFRAIGRTGLKRRTIVHLDGDEVVVRMGLFLHGLRLPEAEPARVPRVCSWR